MKIKGTAVKSTPQFVKDRFKSNYNKWIDSLPEDSKKLMANSINVSEWYPLRESVILPTEAIGKLFYSDVFEAAFEVGRYSAEIALKGVYKVFIMVATPAFMISRATKIFSTYYDDAEIEIQENKNNKAVIVVRKFKKENSLIAHRIVGWIYEALNMMNKKNIQYKVEYNYTSGKEEILIIMEWS